LGKDGPATLNFLTDITELRLAEGGSGAKAARNGEAVISASPDG